MTAPNYEMPDIPDFLRREAPTKPDRTKEPGADVTTVRPPIIIPPALKPLAEQKRWVVWKWEPTESGKRTKVPYKGRTPSKKASTTNSTTWCDLKTAMLVYTEGKADGIGYVLTNGDISGIDIDDCRNATTGELHAWAAEQITCSNSYAE